MSIQPATGAANNPVIAASHTAQARAQRLQADGDRVREEFEQFVGEQFYGQMLKALRSTQQKPAYFNGGRAEEVFQGQLDQILSQEMAGSGLSQWTDPMFELFQLNRK